MLFSRELKVTFVGDSILLGAAAPLTEVFPQSVIDGKVGRQLSQSADVVQSLLDSGSMNDVVDHRASAPTDRSPKTSSTAIMQMLGDREVFLMNTHVPREWQDNVNAMHAELRR